ncbi:MAG: hypothetical protein NVS4B3_10320 [Gemmatimonadaceae bacterium]
MRSIRLTILSCLFTAVLAPAPAFAQAVTGPVCKDGTVSTRTGFTACWMHGGVDPSAASPSVAAKPELRSRAAKSRAGHAVARGDATKASGKKVAARKALPAKHADKKRTVKKVPDKTAHSIGHPWWRRGSSTQPKATVHSKKPHRTTAAPRSATARCLDGSYTHARHRRKACSAHGGVAGWLRSDVPPE